MQSAQPNLFAILVSVLVIGLVLFLRLRRMTAKRPLNPATLWIVPAIFAGIAVLNFAEYPLHGLDWLVDRGRRSCSVRRSAGSAGA